MRKGVECGAGLLKARPKLEARRWERMADPFETLRLEMERAVEALDFETARRLRDRINLMRGGATEAEAAAAETDALDRQRPGAMGLGTSQSRVVPPEGWKRPAKPDPMTKGRSRSRKR